MRVAIAHVFSLIFLSLAEGNEESDQIHYTNSWAVHVDHDVLESVNELANKHGFTNLGQIGSLPGYFHFVKESTKQKNKRSLDDHTELLLAEPMVKWVKQQRVLERSKRNIFPEHEDTERERRDTVVTIQDPFFKDQWYLENIGQSSGPAGLDINVLPAWGQGYSGKGIVVSILDDGVDHTHPDLKKNYDPDASFDFNDFDRDPKPRSKDPLNCHGTKCAGEVAAEANNGICGVGVSFNASIGGIRMLDGKATDTIEGSSLSYHSDYIDIYTCCWGPKDDGKRFGKPGFLASKALKIGAERGRGGKGNIFVWATGNGGLTDDDCNCDGYTTSIYTVSIGAISDHGLSTYYTETCASTLAVTFSGASHRESEENKIVTTGLNHKCTKTFKGTSSAAPLASGMLALVLEANPNLTWRDVQHIIVETSQKTSPLDEGWKKNGAGKEFNHKFGFGKLDAMRMIEKAKSWENVPKQRVCYNKEHDTPRNIPSSGVLIASSNTSSCVGTTSEIRKLEHVQVKISLEHRHRGRLSITLISPSGTRSELLKTRRNDHSTQGLTDWVFMTVQFWGEDPRGSWTLIVTDNDRNTREHHVTKAKQGDFEDVTRVVMDDTEKQGPWDANTINEYDSIEQAPTGNHTPQDHILKGMENTMGELVKGNKFTELAKRKKDRQHGAKGVLGNKSDHAQYKHKSDKNGAKKKALKNYKTETKKHKDLETKESTKKTSRKMNGKNKHKYYKHEGHKKHKYTLNKSHTQKHKDSKNKGQVQGGGKSLMAEGSVEIPKGRTPLEARIAIQALMEPYFKASASRIVLPKRYQGFMGEVDIKMKLVRERNKERMGKNENVMENHRTQLESAREISSPKAQSQKINASQKLEVLEVVKQNNEVQKVTNDLGKEPFGIPSKVINVLEAARQNTELLKPPVEMPGELQGKATNEDNVYINLLNTIKSMPHNRKAVDSSLNNLDERIDILTDAKPYTYENSTRMLKNLNNENRNNSTTGSVFTGRNTTESKFTGSNDTGSDSTGSKFIGKSLNGNGFSGVNSSERNTSGNHVEENSNGGTKYDALRNDGIGNEAVRPVETPIIVYDAVKNQFAELRKLNASDPKMVTGNEVTVTGSNITGNGSKAEGVEDAGKEEPDESSGFGGSSGVVIEEETDCDDGNEFEIECQITKQTKDGLMTQTTEKLNNAVEEANDDDDDDDSDESENVQVIDNTRGFPQPQGSHDFQISNNSPTAKMEPPNDEDKLAYLLSTGKYQGSPGGTPTQGLTQFKELRPLNTSHSKVQNVPDRYNISMGLIQAEESKGLQTSIKHQNVPTPSLKKGLSQSEQKGPLHQNVPDRPVKQVIGPTPSNQDIKIDLSELEPLDRFANKDFRALENALEKQVARLERFRDDSPTGTRFLQRVKDDIRQRNVDDLKFIEDEIQHDMREAVNGRQDGRKAYYDGDSFIAEPGEEPDDNDEDQDDDGEESHRLERRRLSKRASKHELFHRDKNSKDNSKYGEGNSGILKSWTLILYGT